MTARSGLGLVDVIALQTFAALGARPDRPHIKATRVVEAVDDATGLGPGPAYDLILEHARPWMAPIRLVDFHGNMGNLDDEPASPRYTEARLSPAGKLVVDAEAGKIAPVPIGLINGNTHRGGARPPFNPTRLIGALQHLAGHPDTPDAELIELVGPPQFPGGCEIDGDLHDLVAGRPCPVTLRAHIEQTGGNPVEVTIDRLPPGVSTGEILRALHAAAEERPWTHTHRRLAQQVRFPLSDIIDASRSATPRIEVTGRSDATLDDINRFLRTIWHLGTNRLLELPAPLPDLLRSWTTAAPGEDITASLKLLATAV